MENGAELTADGSSGVTREEYDQLVGRIQDSVEYAVPVAETAVVVSRGDDRLVELGAREAWHFPRLEDGRYAGYHPSDSADAIAQLEDARAEGASYLVLPSTAFWWLEFYEDLAGHLDERYETVVSSEDCRIYRLLEEGSWAADRARGGSSHIPGITRANGRIMSQFLEKILPPDSRVAVLSAPGAPLPHGTEAWQPPQRALVDADATGRELAGLATRGVEFLVIPKTAFKWLDDHTAVSEALARDHRLVTRQGHICEVHELTAPPQPMLEAPSLVSAASASAAPRRRASLRERLGLRVPDRNEPMSLGVRPSSP